MGKTLRSKRVNYKMLLLVVILLYALSYSLIFFIGPSNYSDDYAYTWLAYEVYHGAFAESQYDASVRLLTFAPIALFYAAFGITPLSSSAWSMLSYLLTVAITFFIGKEVYNENAGLLGAALLTFFPLINKYATTVNDDTELMLFTSFLILALLLAKKRNSNAWYLISGATLVTLPIVTPYGLFIGVCAVIYLLFELITRGIPANRTTAYLLYGLVLAALVAMGINYASSGNPIITLTTEVASTYNPVLVNGWGNTLNILPGIMFPYNVYHIVVSAIEQGNFNPWSIWSQVYVINYNEVGFYYYIFVVAAAYLLLKRDKKTFYVLFWFFVPLLLFEFGPGSLRFSPFQYILGPKNDRYLLIIAAPMVLTIAIAALKAIEKGRTKKRRISKIRRIGGVIISVAGLLFLVSTAILPGLVWYNMFAYAKYYVVNISNYLSILPNSTKIYFYNGFPVMLYMHYDNYTRFAAYDAIENCSNITQDSYIIIPESMQVSNLDYTPNPENYCPSWRLVLDPINTSYPQYITVAEPYLSAKLYYVPSYNRTAYGEGGQKVVQ